MEFINCNAYKDKIGIYLIRNILNNKVYIGQTQDRFIERYWNHKWKLNNNSHDNRYLQNAWNKYGEECFVFEVIKILQDSKNIDDIERKYIEEYKTNHALYNVQLGGQDRVMKGVKMSDETKRKIGEKNKVNMTGKKLSKQTKDKMSKNRLGKTQWKRCLLTEKEARNIKLLLMSGVRPIDVSNSLSIDYKIVNNIFSNNTYKSVVVEGWNEFYNNRPIYKNHIKNGLRKMTDEMVIELKELKNNDWTQNQLCNLYSISRSTVIKYLNE